MIVYERCAFTGHRVLQGDFDGDLLMRVIENLVKHGTKTFYCGMAAGFDLEAAQTVIQLKKKYQVELVACLPYKKEISPLSETAKLYEKVLNQCDRQVLLSEEYYKGCLHARDRYMVDHADAVISYLRQQRGGTYYTVNYAREQGVKVIEI
jgi:uncharacterized phage-like protein YoqJ